MAFSKNASRLSHRWLLGSKTDTRDLLVILAWDFQPELRMMVEAAVRGGK